MSANKKYSFIELSKKSKSDLSSMPEYRLAVLGDCSTQHLVTSLKGYAATKELAFNVFDADYDQILPQIIDRESEMYVFKPNAILIFMCVEKLHDLWCKTPENDRGLFAESVVETIKGLWSNIELNCTAKILQFTFAEYDDSVFGNYSCKHRESFVYQLRKLNYLLMDSCADNNNIFLVDLLKIQTQIGREKMYDPRLYYAAKMPVSIEALPLIAANVFSVIQALRGQFAKCVILDLDNTLWGGVIGDDGLSGIQIGDLGLGRVYSDIQTYMKELKNRGIILAVCSKNEEDIAKEPFEKLDEMVLRLEDFSIFVANWEDKASNIEKIQQKLNIGFDSMIFVDDNPFERDLVRALIPGIIVPDLPDDPADYLSYLQEQNLFETISYSEEDARRTDQYRAEAQREVLRQQFSDYDEYLKSLNMTAIAAPFDQFNIPRIAQLTQRSNQFNLRTVRYTESEVQAAAENPNRITVYFKLKDKLADHGLISLVIMEKLDDSQLFIDTWVMSCRVLKRGVEEYIINKLVDIANENGYKEIVGEYIRTPKNNIVADVYGKMGFRRTDESFFVADVNTYKKRKTFIEEEGL